VDCSVLAAVAACALAAPLAPPAAQATTPAASAVRFTFIQYDTPGPDLPVTNAKLNAEFVTIHNFASTNRVITGWTIRDLSGHVYKFGAYTLRPGVSLRLHTGNGTNTPTNHYWHQGYYVWTNTGDTAFLKTGSGSAVDSCHWGSLGSGSIHC